MANHDDDEIGWQVIGAVVMKFFAAFFALISNLQDICRTDDLFHSSGICNEIHASSPGKARSFLQGGPALD